MENHEPTSSTKMPILSIKNMDWFTTKSAMMLGVGKAAAMINSTIEMDKAISRFHCVVSKRHRLRWRAVRSGASEFVDERGL